MKLNVNECARNRSDMKLLAKLIVGNVVAQEFKYHPSCLVGLYNRERDHLNAIKHEQSLKSSAFDWYPSYLFSTCHLHHGHEDHKSSVLFLRDGSSYI